ncbi:MAG TPA: Holliday junction branch migration protein RuvA [Homoserinimonas sp.]|nr:Holliday junction branch migration protein RuvA [Homoserinimonas sp.]
MISSVRGVVLAAVGSTVVVEVGGVGLSVTVTPQHALSVQVGSETRLHTALIVREDDLALYGFRESDELGVFDLLRGVTGVGPKSAMGVLAAMSPDQVAAAVATEDDGAFRKVSGIGPKTAKLIVLSLAGKLHISASPTRRETAPDKSTASSVLAALVSLGWSERVATQAVDDAMAEASAEDRAAVPALLRIALAQLGPGQRGEVKTP